MGPLPKNQSATKKKNQMRRPGENAPANSLLNRPRQGNKLKKPQGPNQKGTTKRKAKKTFGKREEEGRGKAQKMNQREGGRKGTTKKKKSQPTKNLAKERWGVELAGHVKYKKKSQKKQ